MAHISVKNVSMSYPLLGGGIASSFGYKKVSGAGEIISSKTNKQKNVLALSNINFDLTNGDMLGLIGRNGCGKSTLLKVIAGIYEPQFGSVRTNGTIASLFSVGLGMQSEATGHRNIELMGLMAGLPMVEVKKIAPSIAAFSELGQYLDLPIRTYSNGMKMRLKFAAGTAYSPDILLMDEWLGAGDESFRKKANIRMDKIVKNAGILIVASHSPSVISQRCNKALWLDKGEVKGFGPVETILSEYRANS